MKRATISEFGKIITSIAMSRYYMIYDIIVTSLRRTVTIQLATMGLAAGCTNECLSPLRSDATCPSP